MRKTITLLVALVGLSIAASSNAQFGGLRNLASGLTGGDQSQEGGLDSMVSNYIESNQQVIQAQIHFATAFDLQDQVALLEAEQQALSSGQVDDDTLEKAKSTSESVDAAILERMESQPELDDQGRSSYSDGLISYFAGLLTAREMVQSARGFGIDLGGNPLGALRGASSAAFVTKELPGYMSRLQSTGGMVLEYGSRNEIEAPSNATSMLDSL